MEQLANEKKRGRRTELSSGLDLQVVKDLDIDGSDTVVMDYHTMRAGSEECTSQGIMNCMQEYRG